MTDMHDTATDPDDDVELGEQVTNRAAGRRGAPVVAVRVSPDLLAKLQEYATTHGMTISEAMRRGAEQLVASTLHLGPTHVTGTMLTGRNLVYGSPTGATGRGQVRLLEPEQRVPGMTVSG